MSDYKVTDAELTAVANAIRTKGGTNADLEWYSGFVSAIESITGGGSTPTQDDPFALTDYIESSGTQYIDTGYIIQSNTKVQAVINVTAMSYYSCIFGTQSVSGSFVIERSYGDGAYLDDHGSTYTVLSGIPAFTNQKILITKCTDGSKIERQDFACAGVAYNNDYNANQYSLYLFCRNNNGTAISLANMKLYRFRIYEGDTIVHEFVPWKDSSDVVCLKDTVTGNLKYNAGSGTFTYGIDS